MTMSNTKSRRVSLPTMLTVVSSTPVDPGKTHPLSPLDHSMALHTIHLIFYYRNNPGGFFDLDRLRISLSEVLSLYPGVTGRLTRGEDGNRAVKFVDAGLRVLKAKVTVTLDEWLRSAGSEEERDLTVWEDMPEDDSYTWSPFRIQINDFVGGGLAIGISCTHMNADPTSIILFMKSWAQIHLGEPVDYPPVFDPTQYRTRTIPNTSINSAKYLATKAKAISQPSKLISATFRFSDPTVKKSLAKIHEKYSNATVFDYLSALFWTRIAKLKSNRYSISICTDFRRTLKEPLPYGYFGNAQHFSLLSIKDEEFNVDDLGHVAGFVNRHVAGLEDGEILSVFDWFNARKTEGGKFDAPFKMYGPDLTCVNLDHFGPLIYSVMLEKDVKPVHASCRIGNVDGEGLIVVMPSPEGGFGRTVTVVLPEEEVGKLCSDHAIMELKPTMLLSGR